MHYFSPENSSVGERPAPRAGPPVRGCKLSDKQIILLCSSQPHTEELDLNDRKQDNPKNIIEYLVIALHNLKVHYQDVDPKAIIACV